MRVLVAHASKHGATAGIAARIGQALAAAGHDVDVRSVKEVGDVSTYDAFVVGSATYFAHWLKAANVFVRDHREALATHPSWLFSSGPLGIETLDEHGDDLRLITEPHDIPRLLAAVRPRQHRVFFGALDPAKLRLPERAMRRLPAGRDLLPEGDFRDWADVDGWAAEIAEHLPSTR